MMPEAVVDAYWVAEEIVRAQLIIKEQEEIIARYKSHFREVDPGYQELEKDGRPKIAVRVTTNSRIDDGLAKEHLDPSTYDAVSKKSVDPAKVRALLTDEKIAEITKHYQNRVEVWLP